MDAISSDRVSKSFPATSAFILYLYRPQIKRGNKEFYYNKDAWNILSSSISPSKKKRGYSSYISSLCSRWKSLLDKKLESLSIPYLVEGSGNNFIDTLQSYRRRYGVRGIALSKHTATSQEKEKQYLFILERICSDTVKLSMIFRQCNLNCREREIVLLLLEDYWFEH